MKILIVSDIHGGIEEFKQVLSQEVFDKLIVLGDLFSYGFHGDIKTQEITDLLQKHKEKLLLIRGNCDRYLSYEEVGLYAYDIITLPFNNHKVTCTHGDRYGRGFLPDEHGDIILTGHTHIPMLIKENGVVYANPGSLSKPRGFSSKSYLLFTEEKLILKTLQGEVIKELNIKL